MDLTILETLTVLSISIIPALLSLLLIRKDPAANAIQSPFANLLSLFSNSMGIVLVLLYIALNQSAGLISMGIFWPFESAIISMPGEIIEVVLSMSGDIIEVVLIGIVMSGLIMIPSTLYFVVVHKLLKKEVKPQIEKPAKAFFSIYKTPKERFALLLILPLAALAEELVFRGYLILLLGDKTGMPFVCAAISVILFAVTHLHYGRKLIPYYLWYAIALTWLTLSSGHLIFAIATHASSNIISALKAWSETSQEPAPCRQDQNNQLLV